MLKFLTPQPGKQTIAIHMFPISQQVKGISK